MKFVSYKRAGKDGIGAVQGEYVIDITASTGLTNLAMALATLGPDGLRAAAHAGKSSFPVTEIESYRPAVADPSLIACVGLNYEEHRVEAGRERTARPTVFLRLASSQVGHGQPIILPPEATGGLDYEGEIAIVIGRAGRRISKETAWQYVFGYSAYNDVSLRNWQAHSTQWTPGKNFPCTGSFGPVVIDLEGQEAPELVLSTRLNGQIVQSSNTSMMIFSIPELIEYISSFVELHPGDVIVTGTPGGVGFKRNPPLLMKDGDVIEVEVSGVGILRNRVVNEKMDNSSGL